MSAKNPVLVAMFSMMLIAVGKVLLASCGNSRIQLAWNPNTEVLEYHSFGAADACWVAQVKTKGQEIKSR